MKQKGLKSLLLAVMLSVLTLLSVSCVGSPEPTQIPVDWPVFPAPPDEVVLEGETVCMPLEYWLEITRYVVAVERVRESMEGD